MKNQDKIIETFLGLSVGNIIAITIFILSAFLIYLAFKVEIWEFIKKRLSKDTIEDENIEVDVEQNEIYEEQKILDRETELYNKVGQYLILSCTNNVENKSIVVVKFNDIIRLVKNEKEDLTELIILKINKTRNIEKAGKIAFLDFRRIKEYNDKFIEVVESVIDDLYENNGIAINMVFEKDIKRIKNHIEIKKEEKKEIVCKIIDKDKFIDFYKKEIEWVVF